MSFRSREEKKGYLLFSNIASFSCTEKECESIEKDEIVQDSSKKKFLVYEKETKKGLFTINYITKWNFFDANNNWVNMSDSFIAASEELNLENKAFTIRSINNEEKEILEEYLKENNISSYSSFSPGRP